MASPLAGIYLLAHFCAKKRLPDYDLHPIYWTDIIKQFVENEFGILPDSFLLI